ncbi:MAG TPA: phosphate acyltransferase PlsX [Candidatus Binataceae bacterium]|nr:phosphate acyltransferase PlsX [Candidatus Binataceae bacterium]
MKIALDAMGGDLAPKATVEGAVLAARDFGIEVVMTGELDLLARELAEHGGAGLPIRIEHAPEAILMDESPIESVIAKPHSSIHVGLELVKRGDASAFISAGNSGAVMAAAMMVLGNLSGIDRPAIASLVPASGGFALLIDAGANTEVKPLNLAQFAVMGSVYWRYVRNVSRPRVGILSNGEEPSKGTELTRAAAAMLAQMPTYVNYIGYVEGRDINRGKVDVIVTDGFTGNAVLKTMEGFASFMLGNLRDLFSANWRTRLSYLLVKKQLTAMRERLDPHEYGGAPLLGLNGVALIAHGSSNPQAIRNAIRTAANEALVHRVNAEILEIVAKTQHSVAAAKPAASKGGFRALFAKMRERLQRHPKDKEHDAAKPAEAHLPPATQVAPVAAMSRAASGELHESPHEPPREQPAPPHSEWPKAEAAKPEAGKPEAAKPEAAKPAGTPAELHHEESVTIEVVPTLNGTSSTAESEPSGHKEIELEPDAEPDEPQRGPKSWD